MHIIYTFIGIGILLFTLIYFTYREIEGTEVKKGTIAAHIGLIVIGLSTFLYGLMNIVLK